VLAAGLGNDAVGDLALEHEHEPVEPRRPGLRLEPTDEEGGGDAIRQVGNDAGSPARCKRAVVYFPCVGGDDVEPVWIERGDGGEGSEAALILLDGDDARCSLKKKGTGEPARPRPDLDDGRAFERPCGAGDTSGQIEVEQEVLAEALLGGEPK